MPAASPAEQGSLGGLAGHGRPESGYRAAVREVRVPLTGTERENVKKVFLRLPTYARLAWGLWRDPQVGRGQKAVLALAAGYSVSPVDLIPGFIPVVGQMDDVLVLLGALRRTLHRLPPEARERHLRAAGVTLADVDRDYRYMRSALTSLAARVAGAGGRMAVRAFRLIRRQTRRA